MRQEVEGDAEERPEKVKRQTTKELKQGLGRWGTGGDGVRDDGLPKEPKERKGMFVFDYTPESKAMLSAATPTGGEADEGWIEVELTADTGACNTVIPKDLCPNIPIMASL